MLVAAILESFNGCKSADELEQECIDPRGKAFPLGIEDSVLPHASVVYCMPGALLELDAGPDSACRVTVDIASKPAR